jgi:hypothetical protein
MAYVPQFIPTNTQVLQGTLDQYQKAADTETNRMNQANDLYSAIPTTRMYDTATKNEVMGKFQKDVIEGLDKKYNYDRSNTQYAKELASEIGKLRSNLLWAHIQQKDEIDKVRTNLIANKGAAYIENFNPNDITMDDKNWAQKLQEWKPLDLKDVQMNAALKAKEYATAWRGRTHDTASVPGTIQYLDQWGARNEQEAALYLREHPEELDASIPEGFNKNDAKVRQTAANAWISNAIGETKPSDSPDPEWNAMKDLAMTRARANKPSTQWVKRDNMPVNEASPIGDMSELEKINKDIQAIDSTVNPTSDQLAQINVLENKVRYAQNEYFTIANSKKGQESIQKGKQIIMENISDPLIDKDRLFREFENFFVQTNPITRSTIGGVAADAGNQVLQIGKDAVSDIVGMAIGKGLAPEDQSNVDALKNKSLKQASKDIASKILGGANVVDEPGRLKKIEKEILGSLQEWRRYYNGVGSYGPVSYKENIAKPLSARLKEGKTMVADIYDAPYSIGSVEYDKAVDVAVRNINSFDVEKEGKNGKLTPVKPDELSSISTRLKENKSKLTIHVAMERESEPRIILTEPDNTKLILKMNVPRMSEATAREFSDETGLPQFKDVFYKDIKLVPGTYRLDNTKDKTLTNILTSRYDTLTPFTGLEVEHIGDSQYIIKSDAIQKLGYPSGYSVNSKTDMFETLDDIYADYKSKK